MTNASGDNNPLVENMVAGGAKLGAGEVPEFDKHRRRFPVVFIIDTSSSTNLGGVNADIHVINDAFAGVIDYLRHPPPGPLADHIEDIDVAIISYNTHPTLALDWTIAPRLQPITPFQADGATATGAALALAFDKVVERIDYFRHPDNNISSAMPNFIHITDGHPTDIRPGTEAWDKIARRLYRSTATSATQEVAKAEVVHFVTPNGCRPDPDATRDANGNPITGQTIMSVLSRPESVFELQTGHPDAVTQTIKLIMATLTSITVLRKTAIEGAQAFAKDNPDVLKETDPDTLRSVE